MMKNKSLHSFKNSLLIQVYLTLAAEKTKTQGKTQAKNSRKKLNPRGATPTSA